MSRINISSKARKLTLSALIIWTFFIVLSMWWNVEDNKHHTYLMALNTARANFNKDLAYRLWASSHGGVYVKPDARTQPSPWMAHVKNRDVVTTDGTKLTLLNPAYMLRQMMEDHSELYGIRGRIVGIVYLNPNNEADQWEANAIREFEKGAKEILETSTIDGEQYLRLMQPMIMEQSCQKCHGHLGFPNGSVRGGISVSVPLAPYIELEEESIRAISITHIAVWLAGIFFISLISSLVKKNLIEKQRATEEITLSAKVFENTLDSTIITDPDANILKVNEAFTTITGYSEDDVIGHKPNLIKSDHHDSMFYQEMWDSINEHGIWKGEIINRRKDGSVITCWLNISSVYDSSGALSHYIGTFNDISAKKEIEKRIQYLAHYDVLTGLPNRALFNDRMQQTINKAQRRDTTFALLFIDLDGFKKVNDSMGHQAGDKLLIKISKRLDKILRMSDTVARLGGDEFTIILNDINSRKDITNVAEKIISELSKPLEIESTEIYVTCSVGISVYPEDGVTVDSLFQHADTAMYKAKDMGRNRYVFYNQEMTSKASEFLNIETLLRNAILENVGLEPYYQPKVCLKTGRMISAEALVRWLHPNEGIIPPGKFITLAEDLKLIDKIDLIVFEKACYDLIKWQNAGFDMTVAVNISGYDINKGELLRNLLSVIKKTGANPEKIELEVTEDFFIRFDVKNRALFSQLREVGFKIAIDDFGTGYSSLHYLRNLEVDILKIDQSFIRELDNDIKNQKLVSTIINMSHDLGLKVTAEGVETYTQYNFIKDKGCDEFQGYYVSKPVSSDDFFDFLKQYSDKPIIQKS